MREWGVPGAAIAIVRPDGVAYAKGYGAREIGKPDPVTPDTAFAIGSTTKAFTAAAIAMLVDEGKMSWDDPVRKHIPWFHLQDPAADQLVTIRDLLTHRTGLSRNDMLWYASPWDREELIRRLAFVRPSRPFRGAWQYNNLMFLTAGYAASHAAGSSWEELVQKRIFDPLGMKSATFHVEDAQKQNDHATGNALRDGKVVTTPWRNIDNIGPAGSINSSVNDLSRWVRLQLNGGVFEGRRLISAASMAEMHTPQMAMRPEDWGRSWNPETRQMTYALGWTLHDYRGRYLVSHGGAIDGFRANITILPDDKLGIIVLSNLGQENMPEALRWTLIDIALGLAPRDWDAELRAHFKKETDDAQAVARKLMDARRPDTKPSLALNQYAGEYFDPGYGKVTIAEDKGRLLISWSNVARAPLEHFQFDTFRGPASTVQFRLRPDGSVQSLIFLDVEFQR
jgi:CubicO group peptidase (beta-lactamase class C family)